MRFKPKCACIYGRVDACLVPPCSFIAVAVHFAMMAAAERDGELVADLAAERPALREAQVVSIARLPSADQARLLRHIPDVLPVPHPARLPERQRALIDTFRPRPFH